MSSEGWLLCKAVAWTSSAMLQVDHTSGTSAAVDVATHLADSKAAFKVTAELQTCCLV